MRSRLSFTPAEVAEKSARICQRIAAEPAWPQARTVALFASLPLEPDVELLWRQVGARKFCYPRMREGELDLVWVADRESLVLTRWGIREPRFDSAQLVLPGEIDLMLVPGLAFTRDGHRLGRGRGFYDRLLAHPALRAVKLGVCFDAQILEELPTEPHDASVDRVVSESA